MSSLRSVLDEMRMEDVGRLDDAALESRLLEIQGASDVLAAERARTLAESSKRRLHRTDGYVSMSAWFADRARVSFGVAKREVETAAALAEMPAAREALAAGEISSSAVGVLVATRANHPEEFEMAERALVDVARECSVRELTAEAQRWSRETDEASGESERRLFERRSFSIAPTLIGTWRVRGELDSETGRTVATAVGSVVDAQVRGGFDLRTSEQRGADAIGEICRRWLDRCDGPTVAGERPHNSLVVDVEPLGGSLGPAAAEDGTSIPDAIARRMTCDASVVRLITKGRSEPLDVGRRTPIVSPALRRAVTARDGGCRFPKCDRPPAWTDAHHVRHWANGGETKIENLVLLCRPHHRMVHEGFTVQMVEGKPEFSRPDGSAIDDRGPP